MSVKKMQLAAETAPMSEMTEAVGLLCAKYGARITMPVIGMNHPAYVEIVKLFHPIKVDVKWETLTPQEKQDPFYSDFDDKLFFEPLDWFITRGK